MNDIVEAQTLHLGPVVEPLEKFLIALIDELIVSTLGPLDRKFCLYTLTITAKVIKNPCSYKRYRDFFLHTVSVSCLNFPSCPAECFSTCR